MALPMPVLPERMPEPDYLPARMLNEFVYCPRLFFYEWVDGVFEESADTVEGAREHRKVDQPGPALPDHPEEDFRTRAITLSSDRLRLIAKIDLAQVENGAVTPVDYKHGKPKSTDKDGLDLWPADRAQLAAQAIVLRDNGYVCNEAMVFYQSTRQRVRIAITEELLRETEGFIAQAWATARRGILPPPLEDSPKCPGCSLAPVCLPDEVNALLRRPIESLQLALFEPDPATEPAPRKAMAKEIRRMAPPRVDLKPVYLNTQGLRLGKSGDHLQVKEKEAIRQELRFHEISQVNLMGNIQVSTQAVQALCEAGIPIAYFSMGGWFYGVTTGMNTKNVYLRMRQFEHAREEWFRLKLARNLVAGKIRNQRTLLMRNHIEPPPLVIDQMRRLVERAERAESAQELLGIEGLAARLYFMSFGGMIKSDEEKDAAAEWSFDFQARNRRPPRDPVNAMLSLGYSMLAKDLTVACYAVGFDPLLGFYHELRYGRPALALDLMEPFRPLIVDSTVLTAINTGMVDTKSFVRSGKSVALTPAGRRAFLHAYELRMDTLVTHPLFEYRVSYRRMLEIQARLLAKFLEGDVPEYPVFTTR
jgi:CRISPR-associated protein Cas1